MTSFPDSKQFQLLARRVHRLRFAITENLHIAKLFVSDTQDANVAELRHKRLYPLDVDLGVLSARAMSQINGKLEHRKAICHNALPEVGIRLAFLLRLRRQIKKHQHPHNSIFAEPVHHNSIVGYTTFRNSPPKHFASEAVVCEAAANKGLR